MSHFDKAHALARLTSLEKEAKHLRTVLERADSLLEPGADLAVTLYKADGAFHSNTCVAEALRILVLLRTMEGTEAPDTVSTRDSSAGKPQYIIEPYFNGDDRRWHVHVRKYLGLGTKLSRISPVFSNEKLAYAALSAVGEGRILDMFFTLHGFTPCAQITQ